MKLPNTEGKQLDNGDPRFWWMELDRANLYDLNDSVTATAINCFDDKALIGIVDEAAGGIIAYAIGEEHANLITNALRGEETND
jgi:hypothetical protein